MRKPRKDIVEPAAFAHLREPSEREKQAIAAARDRHAWRAAPPRIIVNKGAAAKASVEPPHRDAHGWDIHVRDAFGSTSTEFGDILMQQLLNVFPDRPDALEDRYANATLAAVAGIAPGDEAEAMLAVQMAGTHAMAMDMLRRTRGSNTREAMTEYGSLANKMLRTYTAQLEALAKIRRKGQQNVTVKHVHVYDGGQAIVGNVSHSRSGGGRDDKTQHRPQAPKEMEAFADAPGSEMWGADEVRDAVPVAGGEREEPMPDARRREGKRRTEGTG